MTLGRLVVRFTCPRCRRPVYIRGDRSIYARIPSVGEVVARVGGRCPYCGARLAAEPGEVYVGGRLAWRRR